MFVVVLTVRACQRFTRFGRRHFPCVTMVSPTNADIAVKTHTKFATEANSLLLYIVLSFSAVSSNLPSRSIIPTSVKLICTNHICFFVPNYFLYYRLSDPYLYSLNLERFLLRIALWKPSKDPQSAYSPSTLPRGVGHAALPYSLAAANIFCAWRTLVLNPIQARLSNPVYFGQSSRQPTIFHLLKRFPSTLFSSSLYAPSCPPGLLSCPKAGHPRCPTL